MDIVRERRLGLVAGTAGIAAFLLTMAAVTLSASGTSPAAGSDEEDDRALLLDLVRDESQQLLAVGARALSLVLLAIFAIYFYGATRRRNPTHSRFVPAVGIVAFVLVAVTTLLSFVEVRDVARTFTESGPETTMRADDLLDTAREGGLLRAVGVGQVLGGLLFGIWVSLASYEGMKVGILTRFLGLFGIGAGLASVIGLPIGIALFLGWEVSLSLLALGWWPGGRPPAWDEGRAVPWSEIDERRIAARRGSG